MKSLHDIEQRESYSCGVMNCVNGRCVHKLTDDMTDDEIAQEEPLFWAAQQIAELIGDGPWNDA